MTPRTLVVVSCSKCVASVRYFGKDQHFMRVVYRFTQNITVQRIGAAIFFENRIKIASLFRCVFDAVKNNFSQRKNTA